MYIAKLSIGYDRGLSRNDGLDIATEVEASAKIAHQGHETRDGKIIRGLGTHFRSRQDMERVQSRDKIASQIRQAFRERFVATTIDGLYVLPKPGDGKAFAQAIAGLHRDDSGIKVRVVEFSLESQDTQLEAAEIAEWAKRVKNQLDSVQLGRKAEIEDSGLHALEVLSRAPVLSEETGRRIRELVGAARNQQLTRVDLKRSIADIKVEIDQDPIRPTRRLSVVR